MKAILDLVGTLVLAVLYVTVPIILLAIVLAISFKLSEWLG